jgi:putative peptidoglycan lipid II flippase
MAAARSTFSYSMRLVFTLTIPISILTFVLARPVCSLLYERGSFTSMDTLFTSQALMFYSLTIFGAGSSKVLASTFYSLRKPRIPMRASFAAVGLNIVLNLVLMWSLRFRAMALSASLASVLNMVLLLAAMRPALGEYDRKGMISTGVRVLASSLVMGAAAWVTYAGLVSSSEPVSLAWRMICLIIPLAVAVIVFLVLSWVMKIEEVWQLIRDMLGRLRRFREEEMDG